MKNSASPEFPDHLRADDTSVAAEGTHLPRFFTVFVVIFLLLAVVPLLFVFLLLVIFRIARGSLRFIHGGPSESVMSDK